MRVRIMKNVGRALGIAGWLVLAGVAGCDKSSEQNPPSGPSASTNPTPSTAPKAEYSDEAIAFMLGRKYAFACLYTGLDKTTEANDALGAAQTLAGALGITAPTLPAKDGAFSALRAKAIPDELTAKKSAKLSAVYSIGVAVTDAWFGAILGSDPSPALADFERHVATAELPENVYKAQLDDIEAAPTDAKLEKLAADLETHYKK